MARLSAGPTCPPYTARYSWASVKLVISKQLLKHEQQRSLNTSVKELYLHHKLKGCLAASARGGRPATEGMECFSSGSSLLVAPAVMQPPSSVLLLALVFWRGSRWPCLLRPSEETVGSGLFCCGAIAPGPDKFGDTGGVYDGSRAAAEQGV